MIIVLYVVGGIVCVLKVCLGLCDVLIVFEVMFVEFEKDCDLFCGKL